MYTLFALVLTAAAVVIARPPGRVVTTAVSDDEAPMALDSPSRKYIGEFFLPRYRWHQVALEEPRRLEPQLPDTDWLNKEIERLSQLQDSAEVAYSPEEDPNVMSHHFFMKRLLSPPYKTRNPEPQLDIENQPYLQSWVHLMSDYKPYKSSHMTPNRETIAPLRNNTKKTKFALTPLDEGYFEPNEKEVAPDISAPEGLHEGGGQPNVIELEPPRQIRQNPNRNLVAGNLERLVIGLNQDGLYATEKPRPIRIGPHTDALEFEGGSSFYGVAVVSAIGAAVVMAMLAFAIGWYTLSKRAKAAADVDYPAYGVTGPTIDVSGDRKLAHSAHMYHYQHQKQQIIAMERNGMEQRNGSVSDPESEDENEEGDYTVYECPGFATTGDMEVKNPLFNEDPTPATPGKCEVVKPQPKD